MPIYGNTVLDSQPLKQKKLSRSQAEGNDVLMLLKLTFRQIGVYMLVRCTHIRTNFEKKKARQPTLHFNGINRNGSSTQIGIRFIDQIHIASSLLTISLKQFVISRQIFLCLLLTTKLLLRGVSLLSRGNI